MNQSSITEKIIAYFEENEIRPYHPFVVYVITERVLKLHEAKIQEKLDNNTFLTYFLEILGTELSLMSNWSGSYAYFTAEAWLEDSNFHTPANIVSNLMYLTSEQEHELSELTDKMKADNEGKTWIKSDSSK